MASIDRFSIVTLIFFFLSTIFVIHPVRIPISYRGRRRHIPIDLNTAPILAIAILWVSQCLGSTQIRDGIVGTGGIKPYNILIHFISLAYMAITLDITGILQAAAFWVSNRGGRNGRRLYWYFYIVLSLISMVLGNVPVVVSGTAFLTHYTQATSLNPFPWLMLGFAVANTASMVLFVGNPTNLIICEGFNMNNAGFTAYTILPFVACNVFCYVALAIQFRDVKYIPRQLIYTGHQDVRGVLRDPIGAIVGSVILGSCLIIILVLSFFHIDVWKITLPFAGFKFVFDMCWDHYRHVIGQLPEADTQEAEEDVLKHPLQPATKNANILSPTEAEKDGTPIEEIQFKFQSNTRSPKTPELILDTGPFIKSPLDIKPTSKPQIFLKHLSMKRIAFAKHCAALARHFPTFFTVPPQLLFTLISFTFSQFILIEALTRQGWIEAFARWLAIASGGKMFPAIWIVGVMGIILCNIAGTNIGATILLTKIIHQAGFDAPTTRGAAISLAVASNIGAVGFTFSASLAGLLWKTILLSNGIFIGHWRFAKWNLLPLVVMTAVGLSIVCAEMAVLY